MDYLDGRNNLPTDRWWNPVFILFWLSSEKLKKVFEVILALGNYMNGTRRGQAMGFKIDSLHKLKVSVTRNQGNQAIFVADNKAVT